MMKKFISSRFIVLIAMCTTSLMNASSCSEDICEQKHWALPITFDCNLNYKCFDKCGNKKPLADVLFGDHVTFKDLSLFVKLCDQNYVRLQNIDALPPERDDILMGFNPPFGDYRSDLYTTLIAPVTVSFTDAQEKEESVIASLIYRSMLDDLWCSCWTHDIALSVGLTVPFKKKSHEVSLGFLHDGKLFQQIFSPTQTTRETTITQFFSDFTDVSDYFVKQILNKKKLTFEPHQRKIGVGDIALFASAEIVHHFCYLDNWQVGLTLVLPTGGKFHGHKIWEIVLGNGGATQVDLYSNWYFVTHCLDWQCISFLNPAVRFALEISAPFKACYRIPQTVTTKAMNTRREHVDDIPGLDAPARFDQFYVDNFYVDESSIPWFAGERTMTRIKYHRQFLIGLSDYIYHIMYTNCRLGLFYDFSHKGKDHFEPICKPYCPGCRFNTKSIEEFTNRTMHRLGWNLTYKFQNYVELTFGSQHIVAGKNIPRVHDIYLTAVLVF